jgi:hypothetical protein
MSQTSCTGDWCAVCAAHVSRMLESPIIIIIIIIIITISFMQGIYTHIPEPNNGPKEYNVAAILSLLFMVPISLVPVLTLNVLLHQRFPKYVRSAQYGSLLLLLLLLFCATTPVESWLSQQ